MKSEFQTGINHSTNAAYNLWGAEFSAALAAVGLTQYAYTGSPTWGSRTRSGINTDECAEVWYMPDTQDPNLRIYLKFYYGTGAATQRPRLQIEKGTSCSSTGVLSGGFAGSIAKLTYDYADPGASIYYSKFCFVDGQFWFNWKWEGTTSSQPMAYSMTERSRDSSGTATAEAFEDIYWYNNAINCRTYSAVNNTIYTYSTTGVSFESTAQNPYNLTSTLSGGIATTFGHAMIVGGRPKGTLVTGGLYNEFPIWGEQDIALIGATNRHFKVCMAYSSGGKFNVLGLWE